MSSTVKPTTNRISCSLQDPVQIWPFEESLAKIKPKTIPEFFHECCEKYQDLPALVYQKGTTTEEASWETVSYADYENKVQQAALVLLHLGVEPRTSVGILAMNCPEWFYIQLAAIRINAVSAGIYTTNSPEAIFHVLESSEASVVVVEDSHQLAKVRSIRSSLPKLRAVIQLNGPYGFNGNAQKEGYYRWSDLMSMIHSTILREELQVREREVAPNDCAILIFTSGTVGMPKGVMLSHDNILHLAQVINNTVPGVNSGRETVVSFLPLNHVAGQLFDIFMSMHNGAKVYFADRNALKGTLIKTFLEARPTMIVGVPRVFEKIQEKLMLRDSESSRVVRCLSNKARAMMLQHHINRIQGNPTSSLKYWLASIITNRIKTALGLDHSKVTMIGGAPVSEELKRFFLSCDLPLTDVYGLSETSGAVVVAVETPNLLTVGQPLEGVEVKILDPNETGEGEILLRCRSQFMGYLKEVEKTTETIREDGYIMTGDMGHLDQLGNLYVNGRLKELIITSGGENMPPAHIEALIQKELPCLSYAVAIGDRRKFVTALLVFKTDIDPETGYPLDTLLPETIEWLASLDLHYTKLSEMLHIELPENLENFDPNSVEPKLDDKIQKALEDGIKKSNEFAISNAQRVQYFAVLPHNFSMATGELGPTLKIRRNIIHSKYAKIIDKLYNL
ncbi:long-chain-fatty-acid--CoA ligase heimdall-like [Haematobia irritans]|uniref:long-chain-fatty-acid--CoA ligase heimdall-like n=1 Tax=Haematobia irritans TaxID=7368 RepID=UPI003F4F54F2